MTGGNNWNMTAYANDAQNYSGSRTYFFNVIIADILPQWSKNQTSVPNNTQYIPNRNYGFQINWTDDNGISEVKFEWDGTNYSYLSGAVLKTGSTYYYNKTDLPAGSWNYMWYANDTINQWNRTSSLGYAVQINQSNPMKSYLNGTLNSNRSYTYPQSVNATGATVYSNSGTALLWRNENSVSNPERILLGNGTYLYKANTSGTVNYTANSSGIAFYAFVNKGTVTLYLALNGTESNETYVYPQSTNATGWRSPTYNNEGNLTLYRNGVSVDWGVSIATEEIRLGNATYNYTLVFNESQNYTANGVSTRFAFVNKGTPDVKVYLNNTPSSRTVTYPTVVEIRGNSTITVTPPSFNLYRNSTLITSGNPAVSNALPGNGTYNLIYNTSGNENWTSAANNSLFIYVNKGVSTATLTLNPASPISYGTQSNATCTENSPEASGNLYRNGTDVDATENNTLLTLPAGTWNYTCNVSSSGNYTSASDSEMYTVNKGGTLITLYKNGTAWSSDYTTGYPEATNINATINVSSLQGSVTLYRNGSAKSDPEVILLEHRITTTRVTMPTMRIIRVHRTQET